MPPARDPPRTQAERRRSGGRFTIRGSSAIYDALDCAYVSSGEKREPVKVEHEKARSDGETVDDLALVISDVEIGGDPRAGLRVEARGAELVQERREAAAKAKADKAARRGADKIREVLTSDPGQGTEELKRLSGLSGKSYTAALTALGAELDIRQDGRTKRHYLKGGGPCPG